MHGLATFDSDPDQIEAARESAAGPDLSRIITMNSLVRRCFGLATVLSLLSGPALAQTYYNSGPAYETPYHHNWYHERQEEMWRAHERYEAWRHASHNDGFHRDGYHQYGYAAPGPWGY